MMEGRRRLLALAAGAAVGLAYALAPRVKPVETGKPAPAFRLAGLAGEAVSLSDYRGKLVLLSFWASWCTECLEEFPLLERMHKRFAPDGFVVLAPSVDEGGRKAVMPFLARAEPSFPVLLADPKTAAVYGVRGLPSGFLISPEGVVLKRYVGAVKPLTLENDILSHLPRRRS